MCWLTTKEQNTIRKEATEDIPIYKILYKNLRSIYQAHQYKLNRIYQEPCIDTPYRIYNAFSGFGCYSITRGLHSYSSELTKIEYNTEEKEFRVYSLLVRRRLDTFCDYDMIKVNGFIPKGSHYYLNENGEYVSDAIILTEPIMYKNEGI